MKSWTAEFKGHAAKVLLDTISVYLVQKDVYAQHANIVNSSGTGKSCMVDELGKAIITMPLCLLELISIEIYNVCTVDSQIPDS